MGLTCERIHGSQIRVVHSDTRSTLTISFQRTFRVPDKDRVWKLPQGLGRFPLYPVDQYNRTLPKDIVAKGGLFLPMYRKYFGFYWLSSTHFQTEKEAMYIDFNSDESFAVKIYAGDMNVVSGEPMHEPLATQRRRSSPKDKNQSLQDYVVTPKQPWLDGFATAPGKVRQFVPTPLGSGASIYAQARGRGFNGSIQFEVTPRRCRMFVRTKKIPPTGQIFLKVLTGATITIECHTSKTTIHEIKECVEEAVGMPVGEQCLVYAGRQLEDGKSYTPFLDDDYNIEEGSTINMLPPLRGGGPDDSPVIIREMEVAPGGFIEQSIMQDTYPAEIWDHDSAILFNVQILNSVAFSQATGFPPPASPISAAVYVYRGIPLYDLYEERRPVSGALRNIRSLLGLVSREDAADLGHVRTVKLNPKGPAKKFRTVSELEREIGESNTVALESSCGTDASSGTARGGAIPGGTAAIGHKSPPSGLYPGSAESPTSDSSPVKNTTPETRSSWPSAPPIYNSSRQDAGTAATLSSFTSPPQAPDSPNPPVPSAVISTPRELRLVSDAFHFRSLPFPPTIALGSPWLTAAKLYTDAMAPHPNYQICQLNAGGVGNYGGGSRFGGGRVSSERELKLVKDLFRIRRVPIGGIEIGSEWSAVAASYEGFLVGGSGGNSQGTHKVDRKHKRESLLAGVFGGI
ncbi:MAG: hypothetical protein M1839_001262 [Geoglossum umbratile]|nr:MAG: hypothetical protein M1839_001262 [Geoglossum umbratile]